MMLTVLPGLLRVPWLATSSVRESGVAWIWIGVGPTLTRAITFRSAGSITATASSCDSETNARRPSGVKPTCAGPFPTGMRATSLRRPVSMTDTVPPLRFAT
jgi:hypothetical protein